MLLGPKVSAVIASVGREELLQVLKSIVSQTFPVTEIVICFDVLPSEKILSAISSLASQETIPIIILKNEKQMGAAFSYNRAILATSHDLIAIGSDDDPWHSKRIELQTVALEKLNYRAICVTSANYSSESQTRAIKRPKKKISLDADPLIQIYSERPFSRIAKHYIPMSSALIPKTLKNLKFKEDLKAREDIWFLHEAYLLGYPVLQIEYLGVDVFNSLKRTSNRDLDSANSFAQSISTVNKEIAANFLRSHVTRSYVYLGNFTMLRHFRDESLKYAGLNWQDRALVIFHFFGTIYFLMNRVLKKFVSRFKGPQTRFTP